MSFKFYTTFYVNLTVGQTLPKRDKKYTPVLLAAKYGLLELMKKILSAVPDPIYDKTAENRNVVLVAVKKRQPYILMELNNIYKHFWDSLIDEVDIEGNNALHLAAKLSKYKPWDLPGSAMQMQWEIKFYRVPNEFIFANAIANSVSLLKVRTMSYLLIYTNTIFLSSSL